jgi:uncharacterized membrane protein
VLRNVFALLDHRGLTRVGNLRTLVSLAGALVVVVAALVMALVKLLTSVGPVPLAFLGFAVVILGVVIVQKIREHSAVSEVDNSRLMIELYGAQKEERSRRARQIAKEEVDREAKI